MTTTTTEFAAKASFYKTAMLTRTFWRAAFGRRQHQVYVRLLSYNATSDTFDIQMIDGTRDTAARAELSEFCF